MYLSKHTCLHKTIGYVSSHCGVQMIKIMENISITQSDFQIGFYRLYGSNINNHRFDLNSVYKIIGVGGTLVLVRI